MPGDAPTTAGEAALPQPGDVVASRYRIEGLVAQGGMSVVLRAFDLRLGQSVALKVIRRSENRPEEQAKRFLREARIVAQLRSDHVVRVIDVDPTCSPPYLAMELLDGRTLAEVLTARGALDATTALRIAVQACRGVADAHAIGVIHRDLKPSNLMIARAPDGSQRVKVIDFGISKPMLAESDEPSLTASGQILGSPRYMAPEQVRGVARVDGRADVWALGAILYEMIAGEAPFQAPTVADTLARIVRDDPRPLRAIVPATADRVAAVVARCLSKDVALRPPTVRALLDELEASVAPGPIALEDAALMSPHSAHIDTRTGDGVVRGTEWPETPPALGGAATVPDADGLRGMTTRTRTGAPSTSGPNPRSRRRAALVAALGLAALSGAIGLATSIRRMSDRGSTVGSAPDAASVARIAPSGALPMAEAGVESSSVQLDATATVVAAPASTAPRRPRPTRSPPADASPYDGLDLDRRN